MLDPELIKMRTEDLIDTLRQAVLELRDAALSASESVRPNLAARLRRDALEYEDQARVMEGKL